MSFTLSKKPFEKNTFGSIINNLRENICNIERSWNRSIISQLFSILMQKELKDIKNMSEHYKKRE